MLLPDNKKLYKVWRGSIVVAICFDEGMAQSLRHTIIEILPDGAKTRAYLQAHGTWSLA
jgi:hypothetical protein